MARDMETESRPEAVLLALLEAAPRSLDVLMGMIVLTPYIRGRSISELLGQL
jgi:hypothetical protein